MHAIERVGMSLSYVYCMQCYHRAGVGTGPYFKMFQTPSQGESGGVSSNTPAYYAIDHGDIHIVFLDSQFSDITSKGPMAAWLR